MWEPKLLLSQLRAVKHIPTRIRTNANSTAFTRKYKSTSVVLSFPLRVKLTNTTSARERNRMGKIAILKFMLMAEHLLQQIPATLCKSIVTAF